CVPRTRCTPNSSLRAAVASLRRRPLTPRRLGIVVVLVMSLMVTLLARLYYVQLLDPHKPVQSAHLLHDGVIVVPAPRGLIVDARGRPLVANTSAQVITVDRDLLQRRPEHGAAVLARRAVPARPGRGERAGAHRPRNQRAPRAVPRRRGADGDAAQLPVRLA